MHTTLTARPVVAPTLHDPFEVEHTLWPEPRALSFAARIMDLPIDELVRGVAFDLVGAVPKLLGVATEPHPGGGTYAVAYFQLGEPSLAIVTELELPDGVHRVLEVLGIGGESRVRLSAARPRALPADASRTARQALAAGRALGQARLWAPEAGPMIHDLRRGLLRQLVNAGLEPQVLGRNAREPLYRPAAAERLALDALPLDDVRVIDELMGLLAQHPVEGVALRPPRQLGHQLERARRDGAIVAIRCETHRHATGVLHVRRREVEAGVERPGLVRAFNVAGLRGCARLRIRDVGGRALAEWAGSREAVDALRPALARAFGGRT